MLRRPLEPSSASEPSRCCSGYVRVIGRRTRGSVYVIGVSDPRQREVFATTWTTNPMRREDMAVSAGRVAFGVCRRFPKQPTILDSRIVAGFDVGTARAGKNNAANNDFLSCGLLVTVALGAHCMSSQALTRYYSAARSNAFRRANTTFTSMSVLTCRMPSRARPQAGISRKSNGREDGNGGAPETSAIKPGKMARQWHTSATA